MRQPTSGDYWTAIGISLALHIVVGFFLWGTWELTKPEAPEATVELTWTAAPQAQAAPGIVSGPAPSSSVPSSTASPSAAPVATESAPGVVAKPPPTGVSDRPPAEPQPSGPPPDVSVSAAGGPAGLAIIPPKLRERPAVTMPAEVARTGVVSEVFLTVEILENGRVGKISISRSSGSTILDAAARDNVARWQFEPARLPQDGKPVRVMTSILIHIN